MSRILGLDIGDRKVGVAISDPSFTLAKPVQTLIRQDDDGLIKDILDLIVKYDIERIVIGLPYSLNGTIGKQAEKVLAFKDELAKKTSLDIVLEDERLSSVTADRKLREAGKKKDKLKAEMDAAAATVILQAYLDSR